MQLFTAIVTLALLAVPIQVVGAPPPSGELLKTVTKYAGPTQPGSYIVKLKADVSKSDHLAWLAANHNASSVVTHSDWHSAIFHGYAGTVGPEALAALLAHPDVDYIEENGVGNVEATVVQTNAPWGLNRISQTPKLANQNARALNFTYKYDSSAGRDVDIYIIDTGILLTHDEFNGRAFWGGSFCPDCSQTDDNGHGTHVAGVAGGTRYGVAKQARLIAVKTFNAEGQGDAADTISGVNFVGQNVNSTRRASVVNMSIGFAPSTALDTAVANLVASGIHVSVAAGNQDMDALNRSPGRSPSVITVAGTEIGDVRRANSNFGPAVDIYAPAGNIISAWISGPNSTATRAGTSQASPFVAGMIAVFISESGNKTPAAMRTKLNMLSVKNILTGVPPNTVNSLARNDQ